MEVVEVGVDGIELFVKHEVGGSKLVMDVLGVQL